MELDFLNYSDDIKYLITCYHVINQDLEKNNIIIEIYNHKKMKLNFINRYTKYIDKPRDIAIIEIKKTDEIYKDIEFLDYDLNYINKGYIAYKNADIFSIEHPYGDDASCASGKIINIYEYEFDHDIPTDFGSSGCPILLLNNNINLIGVIGIHKEGDYLRKLNAGTFIGEILNKELKDDIKKYKKIKEDKEIKDITENKEIKEIKKIKDIKDIKDKKEIQEYKKNNYIISEIYIRDEDINKDVRIIDSYEEYVRRNK